MTTKVRPTADKALGWAFRPDSDTVAALNRGKSKLKDANLGSDRPHYGGNLAEELVAAKKAEDKRRGKKGMRRRRMAKRVNLKELAALKKGKLTSKKRTVVEAKSNGKLIPLKTICAELDLDPKATRVRLRRLIAKGEIDFHDPSSRWEFTKAQKTLIVNALS
jgi:hypothetical protein